MADFLKRPLAGSLNEVAIQRAADAIQRTGQSLPARVETVVSSGIVTISFQVNAAPFTLPQITVPVVGSPWYRQPIQVGDLGRVVPSDVRLGGVSGLGVGTPDLTQPGNLGALAFEWLGSTNWTDPVDPDAAEVNGPNGAILRDSGSTHSVRVTPAAGVSVDGNVIVKGEELAFFAGSPVVKQTITGDLTAVSDVNAKAVLTSIIAALTAYGLMIDGTT